MAAGIPSEICAVDRTSVHIRGRDLCEDLIGRKSFTEFFHLLLVAAEPTPDQTALLDACLIAIAEHGVTPSVLASRMTYATAPEAIQGALAAGLLGCGSVAVGTAEEAGRLLARGAKESRSEDMTAVALRMVEEYRANKWKLPGFGHNIHRPTDPRAQRLLRLADERKTAGEHVRFARALSSVADRVFGRPLVLNVSTAIPAVLLDVGFPLDAMKAVPLMARAASLLAHIREEMARPASIEFALTANPA
jgi:citrate synthase